MGFFEYAGYQLPIGLVIIRHQQGSRREVIEVHRSARLGVVSHRQPFRNGDIRQLQVEHRALADYTLDRQDAPHQVHDALDDGQADAGAFLFGRLAGIRLHKWFEHFFEFVRRYPDAGVFNINHQRSAAGAFLTLPGDPQLDTTSLGELDSVAQQVHQDLAQPQPIQQQRTRQIR